MFFFMRHLFLLTICILLGITCMAQTVSYARFEQVGKTIKIYYDLSEVSDVSIYLSTNGGKSFENSPLTNVSGDVGKNVKSGKGKVAVWDVLASREKLQGERICFKVCVNNLQYVDLGLPSGTRWKKEDEKGFYTYDEAVDKFGDRLPTKKQLEELKDMCRWTWNGSGYNVIGPNGNLIVMHATGYLDCNRVFGGGRKNLGRYWSSTSGASGYAWDCCFTSGSVFMNFVNQCYFESVRLVQD